MSERTLEISGVIDYNKNEIPADSQPGLDICIHFAGE
jgi:hypothetical protein